MVIVKTEDLRRRFILSVLIGSLLLPFLGAVSFLNTVPATSWHSGLLTTIKGITGLIVLSYVYAGPVSIVHAVLMSLFGLLSIRPQFKEKSFSIYLISFFIIGGLLGLAAPLGCIRYRSGEWSNLWWARISLSGAITGMTLCWFWHRDRGSRA